MSIQSIYQMPSNEIIRIEHQIQNKDAPPLTKHHWISPHEKGKKRVKEGKDSHIANWELGSMSVECYIVSLGASSDWAPLIFSAKEGN